MRVDVAGRVLGLSNLDKPLYPDGTAKAEVIEYYSRIAPVMLPHLADRSLTRIRYPDGADRPGFFEKNAPAGRPAWVPTSPDGLIICQEQATLVWLANLAALELHAPQWRLDKPGSRQAKPLPPDRLVFDLDPGPSTGLDECRAVALALRDRLAVDGRKAFPKTSGRKGMQVSSKFDGSFDEVTAYARDIAGEFARAAPKLITDQMAKELRSGKVFIDWSQNNAAKTTVCVYSLRAGDSPTVSAPLTWDEVAEGDFTAADFTPSAVLDRVEQFGDLHQGLC